MLGRSSLRAAASLPRGLSLRSPALSFASTTAPRAVPRVSLTALAAKRSPALSAAMKAAISAVLSANNARSLHTTAALARTNKSPASTASALPGAARTAAPRRALFVPPEIHTRKLTDLEVQAINSDPEALEVYGLSDSARSMLRRNMLASAFTGALYPFAVIVLNNYVAYPYSIGVGLMGALLCARQVMNFLALRMAVTRMTCVWPTWEELAADRADDADTREALSLREGEHRSMYMAEVASRKDAAEAREQALKEGKTEEEADAIAREIIAKNEPVFEAEQETLEAMPARLIIHRIGNPFSSLGNVIEVDPTKIKVRRVSAINPRLPLLPEDPAQATKDALAKGDRSLTNLLFWADDSTPVIINAAHVKHVAAVNQLFQAANVNGAAEAIKVSPISRSMGPRAQAPTKPTKGAAAAEAGAEPGASGAAQAV